MAENKEQTKKQEKKKETKEDIVRATLVETQKSLKSFVHKHQKSIPNDMIALPRVQFEQFVDSLTNE